ncbi:MAG: hypothetical protein ACP6IU_10905 [Candidatus Asgardarchaeia archaeon]
MRKTQILRYWTYFRRGHNVYLAFLISFANFVAIQYSLVIKTIEQLSFVFPDLITFGITFFLIYLPVATVIGWIDYKKASVPIDAAVGAKANPFFMDLARAISLLAEGKNEEAIKTLRRWTESP